MWKIVIACLEMCVGCIGIDLALVKTETFSKLAVVNSVITEGHYCKGEEAMCLANRDHGN